MNQNQTVLAVNTTTTESKADTKKPVDPKLAEQLKAMPNMSARIRFLNSQKMSRGDIARTLSEVFKKEVKYQWVRNVLITPVKNPVAVVTAK